MIPVRSAALAVLALLVVSCAPTASSPTPTVTASPTATTATATASPTPTPTAQARIQVSDSPITGSGGKLLLFQLPSETHLRAITWDASVSGTLPGQIPPSGVWSQAPYGSPYLVGTTIFDRDGKSLGTVPWPSKIRPTWAIEGNSLCAAVPEREATGATMRVERLIIGQSVQVVASGFATYSDNAGYPVLACDSRRDRVVVGAFGQGVSALRLWVFRLSTGAIIRTVDYSGGIGTWVAVSADGALLAEAVPEGSLPTDKWTTTIRNTADGMALGTIDGLVGQGFSADGSLLVAARAGKTPTVLNWKTRREVWTTADGAYNGYRAEPAGRHLAVSVQRSDREDVYIVSPDGSAVLMPAGARVALPY